MEDQKEEVNYSNKKSWFLGQFLLYRELRGKKKKSQVYEKKDPAIRVHGNNSSIPPPKASAAILLGNYVPWKGGTKTFWGLLNTGSEIALILGYRKQHHVSPVWSGCTRTRKHGVLTKIWLQGVLCSSESMHPLNGHFSGSWGYN